jgi:hypothetical protein
MTKIFRFSFLVLVFILSAEFLLADNKKTILDYFMLIPDEYFQCEISGEITPQKKKESIKRVNIKNGYIAAESEKFPMEAALFTDDYLGISVVAVNVNCGEGCMCNKFALLIPDSKGKLIESSNFIFPDASEIEKKLKEKSDSYGFILTETGIDINVVDNLSKKTLLLIRWRGGMFVIE